MIETKSTHWLTLKLLLSYVVLISLTYYCGIAAAQDGKENSFGIGFGASNFHIRDKHATELIFRGNGIAPSIFYKHANPKNSHIIEGFFYYNKLSSSSDIYKTVMLGGHFRYSYLRTLMNSTLFDSQMRLSAGVSVNSFFMKSNYEFYMPTLWATAIKSWYGSHSADVASRFYYNPGKNNRFEVLLYVPVISNVSRPAYSPSGDYNYEKRDRVIKAFGNTMIIPENLVLDTHFFYEHNLNSRLSLRAEYEFYFARCKQPDPVRLYMNNLRIGVTYRYRS